MDGLIVKLNALGDHARFFKVDISRTFRNVRIDTGDAIHLGIKWKDKYYIDQNLAFGAVHGTAIFERITDFVRFLMAKKGFQIHNYIDDLYGGCHEDDADVAFNSLLDILNNLGLPVNPAKVFSPTNRLAIMGIIVYVESRRFSIEQEKLDEISPECVSAFLATRLSKRDLQSLLGKLLYISRCIKNSCAFLNRMLQTLRDHHDVEHIYPVEGFCIDVLWFLKYLNSSNGVIRFCKGPVAYIAHVEPTLTHIGGVLGSRVYAVDIPFKDLAITQCEMYNIVVAAKLWGHEWENKVVNIKCDNESAVAVCSTGKTRNDFFNICLFNLWLITAKYNIELRVSHIKGVDNTVADVLSRGNFRDLGQVSWVEVSNEILS